MSTFAVLGGGIAGLSATWELERAGHDVVLYDRAARLGGKLQQSPVPGLDFLVEEGADAFLARVPDALELCDELGIDDLVNPATGNAWVDAGDGLRPLPRSQLLGLPTDLDEVAGSGLLTTEGIDRARADLDSDAPPLTSDTSVGALIRERLGDEVCERLVEPLVGGINAGEADGLSLRASAPQIWACAQQGGSLIRAAAAMRAGTDATGPVFASPAAGMAALPRTLAERLRAERRLRWSVQEIRPVDDGVLVDQSRYAGVVLATPAPAVARLLRPVHPDAADVLDTWRFADVVMVTIAARADQVDHPMDGSGFIVTRDAGRRVTAGSWASSKWPHWNDGEHVLFRVSIGHDTDPEDWCAQTDDILTWTALNDLQSIMDTEIRPVGYRVGRWAQSFPQYRPGHIDRVAGIRAAIRGCGRIAIAGMSFDGIGVPACIRGGRAAARSVMD